jgi:hypothetical protein
MNIGMSRRALYGHIVMHTAGRFLIDLSPPSRDPIERGLELVAAMQLTATPAKVWLFALHDDNEQVVVHHCADPGECLDRHFDDRRRHHPTGSMVVVDHRGTARVEAWGPGHSARWVRDGE